MSFSPFELRGLAVAAVILGGTPFLTPVKAGEALWELAQPTQTGEDGWRVDRGRLAEGDDGGLKIEPELGQGFRMYRYVAFDFTDLERPNRYLQIKARSGHSQAIGIVTDVSSQGGAVGAWSTGVTTFDLLNTPSFRKKEGTKGTWAISLYSNDEFIIESISCTAELTDGITFERVDGEGNLSVKTGDKLRVKAFVSDSEQAKQGPLQAELVWRNKTAKNAIKVWSGKQSPEVALSKTSEGHFEGELTLDEELAGLMSESNGPAMLGVRLLSVGTPLLGWAPYTAEEEASAGPTDWQQKLGDETGSREKWREITKGEELARGLPVQFIPKPDYRLTTDENDPHDLTDGVLSSRADDRIWFAKDAVGWYLNTTGRQISMIVDLGELQPVGKVALRLLGGKEQSGLRLPNQIEILASENGKDYHAIQSMVKLMAAEAELSDFKKAFYVPEDGQAFVQAFECMEPVNARYIAIRIHPEASVFTDEISIQKATSEASVRTVAEFPAATLLTTGIAIKPRQSVLSVTSGAITPNWFMIEEGEQAPFKTHSFELTVPEGIKFSASDFFQPSKKEHHPDKGTATYTFDNLQTLKRRNFSLYLKCDPSLPVPDGAKARLASLVDGELSQAVEVPLQVLPIPEGPLPDHLDISLAWMHEGTQQRWPEFAESFRKMGFGFMSTFPRFWQRRDAARSWIPDVKARGLAVVEAARANGYKVVMNDSPFAEMKHTIIANLKENLIDEAELKELSLQTSDGSTIDVRKGDYFNPFYRGRFYQMEIDRIAELVRLTQPDHVYWDIEIWWRAAARAKDDPRLTEAWKRTEMPWNDFLLQAGTEMLKDLQGAVKKGMAGKPLPVIGAYHAYASQASPSDALFDWKRIYPNYVDISMPSLYVQGRLADVAQRVRDDYAAVGKNIIPWLTPGTYGPVKPEVMEPMVLETILNGARGFTYYEYADFDPAHFYYHTRALILLGRYRDLLKSGKPVAIKGSNAAMRYTCFTSDKEALLLIGNYARSPETATEVQLPKGFENAVEVFFGREQGNQSNGTILKTSVEPSEYRLFYLK